MEEECRISKILEFLLKLELDDNMVDYFVEASQLLVLGSAAGVQKCLSKIVGTFWKVRNPHITKISVSDWK